MRPLHVLVVALAVLSGVARTGVPSPIGNPDGRYTIRLAGAEVRETRAPAGDTINAWLGVHVNGRSRGTAVWDGRGLRRDLQMLIDEGREWTRGEHLFSTHNGGVTQVQTGPVGPGDRVVVTFGVSAGGYVDLRTAQQTSNACVDATPAHLLTCLTNGVGHTFKAPCDGFVAADTVVFSGRQLAGLMRAGDDGTLHAAFSKSYAGLGAPSGCGAAAGYRIDLEIFSDK